ncbi:hypothetical protein Taro_042567 [Colocasia esculenta]|uniref:Uncharacterized protein n=1 Tax=Colocasia esculenta TaxID=4460 RepID=A0A843X2U9_COLES|nr:hypothetical protein [Colocasia esculenta]
MNATYRVVVFFKATGVLSPSGPFQHAAMQNCPSLMLDLQGSGARVERRWHEMTMWRNEAK